MAKNKGFLKNIMERNEARQKRQKKEREEFRKKYPDRYIDVEERTSDKYIVSKGWDFWIYTLGFTILVWIIALLATS